MSKYPSCQEFESWDLMINALKYDYTTSLRNVCQLLKASRNWVNQYIRPFVKHVYLNSNMRNNSFTGINWVRVAAYELQRDMTENIWFHTDELKEYIYSSINKVTKQTKSVPVTFFMTEANSIKYKNKLVEYNKEIDNTKNIRERGLLIQKRDNCYLEYIYKDPYTKSLFNNKMNVGKRTLATPLEVNLPNRPIEAWVAPHDLKKYGDTDEKIYREFFRDGHIKIELLFPDTNGSIGRKVYYLPDPEPLIDNAASIIFSEIDWQNYLTHKKDKL